MFHCFSIGLYLLLLFLLFILLVLGHFSFSVGSYRCTFGRAENLCSGCNQIVNHMNLTVRERASVVRIFKVRFTNNYEQSGRTHRHISRTYGLLFSVTVFSQRKTLTTETKAECLSLMYTMCVYVGSVLRACCMIMGRCYLPFEYACGYIHFVGFERSVYVLQEICLHWLTVVCLCVQCPFRTCFTIRKTLSCVCVWSVYFFFPLNLLFEYGKCARHYSQIKYCMFCMPVRKHPSENCISTIFCFELKININFKLCDFESQHFDVKSMKMNENCVPYKCRAFCSFVSFLAPGANWSRQSRHMISSTVQPHYVYFP